MAASSIQLSVAIGVGATIRTDNDGTDEWQYMKLAFGADGTQTIVTSTATNPFPVALSDTDNAVLDSMVTSLQLLDNAVSGAGYNITQFNGASVPIGAGVEAAALRVTVATDSTGVLSVDDNGGSLTVDNAQLSVVGGGTEAAAMRVTIANNSTGVISIDDNGGSLTVDNGGTFVIQEDGAALTALQVLDNTIIVDDAAFTPATTSVNMAGFTFDDTAPDSIDEGDGGAARMSANRNIYSTLRDAAGNERGVNINASNQLEINIGAQTADVTIADGGNNISVDWGGTTPPIGAGTEAAALRVTLATDSTGLVSVDDNGGSLTIDNAALSVTGGGVEASALRVTLANDSTGVVSIDDNGGAITVDNGGTFVTQIDGDALTSLQLIDNSIFADDAAFTLTSSSVTMAGGIRDDSLSALSAVEGDAIPFRFGSTGALHVTGGGGGTEYSEDVATPATIVGTATMMERDDVLSTVTPVEADWISFRGTAEGALWTQDFNSDAILSDTSSIDGKITACDTGAVVISSGTVTNLSQMGGVAISLNTGVRDTGTQRVTIATDDSLPVTNAGTFATQATLQENSGVDIGDVGVLTCGTITPGTAATSLGKAQDTAVGSTDTGVAVLLQRDDEQAAVTPIDGDYVVPRCDKFGNTKVTQLPDATSVIQYGVINVATSGNNTLQAAIGAGIKIRVLSMAYTCGGTVNVRIESAAGGTALTGIQEWVVNTGMVLPFNPGGWFETADNALLNMELSAAVNVDGCFSYVEV
jgi:hypothetical protein